MQVTHNGKINDKLYLIRVNRDVSNPHHVVHNAVNHIITIDCSGSMTESLPLIREQLKSKMVSLLKDHDTVSIIWFSGKGECGVLLENQEVVGLRDLKHLGEVIDRWLKPVGMTGFKDPLQMIKQVTDKIKNNNPISLFFMTDGCDNQWSRPDLVKTVESCLKNVTSCTFVEYGLYADRQLLTTMAEKCGGSLVLSEDFNEFELQLENKLKQRNIWGGKRIEEKLLGDVQFGFAFSNQQQDLLTFDAMNGKILIPEDLHEYFYLSSNPVGESQAAMDKSPFYAAMSLLAVRMKSDAIYSILKTIPDVNLIRQYSQCFGKQRYSDFIEYTKKAAFNDTLKGIEGYDFNLIPKDDAFTVLDLLELLVEENSSLLLDGMNYNRMSRAREDTDLNALKFVPNKNAEIPIVGLTYNEDRPNISILVKREGHVDLTHKLENSSDSVKQKLRNVVNSFETHIFRNYNIIKDGYVNINNLDVRVNEKVQMKLAENNIEMFGIPNVPNAITINIRDIPVINRKMVKEVSAKSLIELEWQLIKSRAAQKVYNSLYKERFETTKSAQGLGVVYGKETSDWLMSVGLTDNGFAPVHTKQVDSKDFYIGKELSVSIKGYSKLPSLKELTDKLNIINKDPKKKLTPSEAVMVPYFDESGLFFKNNEEKFHKSWLEGKMKETTTLTRSIIQKMAKIKFAIVLGQVWFTEFKSLEENTLTITCDNISLTGKIEMNDIQVKI